MYPEDSFEFAPVEREPFDVGLFLAGVFTGAAIGAGLALLFAPQSGEETRHGIADAGASLRDKVSSGYSNAADRTTSTLGSARDKVTSTVGEAKHAVEDWVSHTKHAIDDTRQRLDAAVEAGRTAYEEKKIELDAQVDASLEA